MASVNKITLIGNLGADPEIRYLPSGDAVANLSLATTETWKDKATGEKKEATEWWRISFFGKVAEVCAQYLKKGSQIYIEGRGRTEKWQDKEGVDRYTFKVVGEKLTMLGKREDDTPTPKQTARPAGEPTRRQPAGDFTNMDDDIPF